MTTDLDRIAQKIDALAQAELSSGQPYLLSKLGMDLGGDLKIIKQSGQPLTKFIEERFEGVYKIIFTGTHRNIQSIILAESSPAASVASSTKDPKPKPARFHYRFWAAFSVPPTDKERFLNTETLNFMDVDSKPVGPYESIERRYIADTEIDGRDEKIIENIRAWIKAKGLSEEQFFARSRPKEPTTGNVGQQTLLHAFLDVMDKKQIAALSLPLEVIAAMLRKQL